MSEIRYKITMLLDRGGDGGADEGEQRRVTTILSGNLA